ncbi:MAG: ABC transporter permease [Betaproteobacteria bacterium]|nr:ABC transporter permease [Betaproteobacteria bacterium]
MPALWTGVVLPARNLVRRPKRTGTALLAIVSGIVALLLAGGYIQWVYFAMREGTILAHLGHLQIVRPGFFESGKSDPFRYLLPKDERVLNDFAKESGVVTVAPRISLSGLVSHGDSTLAFIGEAIDPSREKELSESLVIVDGASLREGDPDAVMFGEGLARNLGVGVGDRVVLLVTQASGGINAVELSVRGTFSTVTKAYDDAALRLPIETARRLLRIEGAHTWVILLDDTDRTTNLATSLRGRLSPSDFQVVPWYDLADFYNKTVALFSKQVDIVKIIISAIIVLGITNSMMMSVMERTGEIGTAMALGAERRRVLGSFITEGALLGIFGGLIGLAIAFPLGILISRIGIPMPAPPGMAHGFVGQILITPRLAAEGLALAIVTAVLASIYPAWRASRLSIVDALRYNR